MTDYYNATNTLVNTTSNMTGVGSSANSYTLVYDNSSEILSYSLIFGGVASAFIWIAGMFRKDEDEEEDLGYEDGE